MRRNVDPDFEFNKDRFADVLKSAIGDRSYSAFAKESDLSFGYISKYMNKKSDVAPTIQTIKKMAKVAHVTYAELLNAAGYDETKYEDDEISLAVAQASPEWSPMNALLPTLYQTDFNWKFMDTTSGEPLSVKVDGAPFEMWYFIPVYKDAISKEDITAILGCKEAESIKPGSKVTFLTANEEIYELLKDMEFNLLMILISVAYIRPESSVVEKEQYVKTAIEITEEEEKVILKYSDGENQGPLYL